MGQWGAEQIAYRLRIEFPEDESMRMSREAIHQALDIHVRGALTRERVAYPASGTQCAPTTTIPDARYGTWAPTCPSTAPRHYDLQ